MHIEYVKIVELLIEKGANVNAVNRDGLSVLDVASNATTGDLQMPKTILIILTYCSLRFYTFDQ